MKQLIASILGVAAEDITTFGMIFGLIGTAVFLAIPLLWLKETFDWIPKAIGKRREKNRQAKQKEAETQSLHAKDEARYQDYLTGRQAGGNKLLDYVEFQSIRELPKDPVFVKRLMNFLDNNGDYHRGFLCRQLLAEVYEDQEVGMAYAENLLQGEGCRKNVFEGLAFLNRMDTAEAHYRLYQFHSSPQSEVYSLLSAAEHLLAAKTKGARDARITVNTLYRQAEKGDGRCAYLIYLYLMCKSETIDFSQSQLDETCISLEMLFWLMIAKELDFPEAVELYCKSAEEDDFAARSADAWKEATKIIYRMSEGNADDLLLSVTMAAALGNYSALKLLGKLLQHEKCPVYRFQLGQLCLEITEGKEYLHNL